MRWKHGYIRVRPDHEDEALLTHQHRHSQAFKANSTQITNSTHQVFTTSLQATNPSSSSPWPSSTSSYSRSPHWRLSMPYPAWPLNLAMPPPLPPTTPPSSTNATLTARAATSTATRATNTPLASAAGLIGMWSSRGGSTPNGYLPRARPTAQARRAVLSPR